MDIKPEKRYEVVTSSARYHNEKIIEAFQLFIKLTTAVIAGVVYLALSGLEIDKLNSLAWVAVVAEGLICLVCVTIMIANIRAWWGFRIAESELVGKISDGTYIVSKPKFPRSCLAELVMIFVVILTFVVFVFVNPIGDLCS